MVVTTQSEQFKQEEASWWKLLAQLFDVGIHFINVDIHTYNTKKQFDVSSIIYNFDSASIEN